MNIDELNGIYKSIAQLTSIEDCLIFYKNFKGLTITFPTKLIDAEFVKECLRNELKTKQTISRVDIQRIAIATDYSERQIRRFLSEVRMEEGETH